MENWQDLDGPNPLVKALGQDGADALSARAQRFIASSRTFMIAARPDLGIAPPSGYLPKLAVMNTTSVAPGRVADYEKVSKELRTIIAKTNVKGMLVGRIGFGGNPNEYRSLVLLDSFADLEQFGTAFTKAVAEPKLAPMPAGMVMNTERTTVRYVPELSIQAAAQKPPK